MANKTTALKRTAPVARTRVVPHQSANISALAPENIEQAADLGAGYVIIKLRNDAPPGRSIGTRGKLSQPGDGDIPVMPRSRLVTALRRGGKLAGIQELHKRPAENESFLRNMAGQERARRAQLIEQGRLITAQELSQRLRVSTQAISKSFKAGRLFAFEGDGSRLWYPAFFADGSLSRRDLHAVTQALGAIPPSSKWQFFTCPKASLGGITPLQALQQGDRAAVLVSAAGFVER